jgi:hypothetical protein
MLKDTLNIKLIILIYFNIMVIKILLLFGIAYCNLIYTGHTKSLVLLDDWHYVETHSLFWDQLRSMGFELNFKMIDDPSIKLTYFGEYLYNNVIFFAPTYNDGNNYINLDFSKTSDIKITTLLKYLDEDHDIMIFGSKDVGNFLRKFVNEFGVDFDDYVIFLI